MRWLILFAVFVVSFLAGAFFAGVSWSYCPDQKALIGKPANVDPDAIARQFGKALAVEDDEGLLVRTKSLVACGDTVWVEKEEKAYYRYELTGVRRVVLIRFPIRFGVMGR